MYNKVRGSYHFRYPNWDIVFIVFILGYSSSFLATQELVSSISSLMLAASSRRMSIVSLLIAIFPVFLISVSTYYRRSLPVYLYFYFKTFCVGLILQALRMTFIAGDWLVCFLLLFSDFLILFICALFYMKNRYSARRCFDQNFIIYATLCFVVRLLDYHYISPYLAQLFNS